MGSRESERRPEFPKMSRVVAGKPGDGVRAYFVQDYCLQKVSRALDGEENTGSHILTLKSILLGHHVSPQARVPNTKALSTGVGTAASMLSKARPLPWLHLEFRGGGSSWCPTEEEIWWRP